MIGKLRGKVDAIGDTHCIVDVNGVGYEVQASNRALRDMTIGGDVTLTIDTHVREDAIRLYGFASEVERTWFRSLQNVQGVGAKVALGVLGVLAPPDLANAITVGDWAAVGQTPGVGKKIAQRIVTELKDKAPALSLTPLAQASQSDNASNSDAQSDSGLAVAEALSALNNLGYSPQQASEAIASAAKTLGADAATGELIRQGLKCLAR
ncbi:MAG: Holliday junction branch migration protein RuvA [Hyphomicrobiaceae bacterium]